MATRRTNLENNTLVNPLPSGVFLRVAPGAGAVRAVNNLLVGAGSLESAGPGDYRNNFTVDAGDFALASAYDYRLKPGTRAAGKAVERSIAEMIRAWKPRFC